MTNVRPYKIAVSDAELQRLNQKLADATFPEEIEDAGWDYGVPLADLKRLATYWKDKFDWRKTEAELNKLPHFLATIEVDGFGPFDIHFVHQKSSNKNAIPLIFVHGWPGNFYEGLKLLDQLKDGVDAKGPSFDVVVVSLPNFGFSSRAKKRGFALKQYAEACHKVMLAIGYDEYVTQGGDWGSFITRIMGINYPSSVKVSHLNFLYIAPASIWKTPIEFVKMMSSFIFKLYPAKEMESLERAKKFQEKESAYSLLHSTKPQTLAYALADSPVALLAWIYEKLRNWTDDYPWTEEEVLTWISIYWFSTSGSYAHPFIYYEVAPELTGHEYVPNVKTGMSYFPKEVISLPKAWASRAGEIVFMADHQKGGHFAAYEAPEAVAGDLRIMLSKGGPAYNVVNGRSGHD